MSNYLIPSDESYVEVVAKSIAKARLHRQVSDSLTEMANIKLEDSGSLESMFEVLFNRMWTSNAEADVYDKELYKIDARAAIAAINLKLITG